MLAKLTAEELETNNKREQEGFEPYIKLICHICSETSPFRTRDELAVSGWIVYTSTIKCPKHLVYSAMYTIRKWFDFSASHKLNGLPKTHPCGRNHGHNYKVEIILRSNSLNEIGFVKDYRELDEIKKWLDLHFDHQNLNECVKFNPTAENLASFIFDCWISSIPELAAVTVKETDKTSATYART